MISQNTTVLKAESKQVKHVLKMEVFYGGTNDRVIEVFKSIIASSTAKLQEDEKAASHVLKLRKFRTIFLEVLENLSKQELSRLETNSSGQASHQCRDLTTLLEISLSCSTSIIVVKPLVGFLFPPIQKNLFHTYLF